MSEAISGMESVNLMKMRNVLRALLLAIVLMIAAAPACADVWLPSSLTEIEAQAFMNAAWLSGSCTIPEGTKTIGAQAFYGCSGITSLKIASSVRSIGSGAFANCTGLTGTVTIPDGCEVADNAFENCPNLKVVYAGQASTQLFTWKTSAGKATITGYKGDKDITSITVPAYVDGCTVTAIDAYVFSSNRYLTHISLPSTLTTIGDYAFSYCSNLTSVSMPTSVKKLGRYAFYYSSALDSTFELIDAEIPSNAFTGCNELDVFAYTTNNDGSLTLSRYYGSKASVNVSRRVGQQNVTAIGREAFSYRTSLQQVSLPEGMTAIGPSAFYYCTALERVSIPFGVTTIGANAFYNCTAMTNLSLPQSINSIGSMAFRDCTNLQGSYSFIDAEVNSSAFTGTNGVTVWCFDRVSGAEVKLDSCISSAAELSVPASVQNHTVIGMNPQAFYGCANVQSISLPDTFTGICDEAFYKCTTLKSVNVPSGATFIGASAFQGCTSLTSISVPASVGSIGAQAFYNCTALNSVTIASSATKLDAYAFADCSALTSISMPGDFSNVGNMALTGTPFMTRKVASIAVSLTAGCTSDYDRAKVLHDWLIRNTSYDMSYSYYGPEGVLFHGLGVCNAYTVTYSMLLDAVGVQNMTVSGTATDRGTGTTGSHAWTLVKLDGAWYHVDTTWDDPVPNGRERDTYFCLTDNVMAKDHQWNTAKYPAAGVYTASRLSTVSKSVEEVEEMTEDVQENEEAEENRIQVAENLRKDKKTKKK